MKSTRASSKLAVIVTAACCRCGAVTWSSTRTARGDSRPRERSMTGRGTPFLRVVGCVHLSTTVCVALCSILTVCQVCSRVRLGACTCQPPFVLHCILSGQCAKRLFSCVDVIAQLRTARTRSHLPPKYVSYPTRDDTASALLFHAESFLQCKPHLLPRLNLPSAYDAMCEETSHDRCLAGRCHV